ncbi:hypothetical protein [Hufsiella ginkgonis]|uniref:SGNH/GDSL hydrolase family protein n=1 Tax=Hufsiella ginkgonis TaxID=2695274 RepID=A0A7K1Y2J9_9SPHI|nr:hypothetical protein [Hufsiella ginkgonis]MXV17471.1 hypothetical protein [Hufsiella ginkgonis]
MADLLRINYHRLKNYLAYNNFVLGRTACLGQDVFNLKFNKTTSAKELINMQKVRADLFVDLANGKARPAAAVVGPFIARDNVYPFIVQQEKFEWGHPRKTADWVLIDSFSELTDQKFTHRTEGWSFCANYSDLDHSPEFMSLFENKGLLDPDELEQTYVNFFSTINRRFPGKKIVFIHFPTTLDLREKFVERGDRIAKVINRLAGTFKLTNLQIDARDVFPHSGDDFAYHFSTETQTAFLNKWNQAL